MRPESMVAAIAARVKAGSSLDGLADRLEEYVREAVNHERREVATALMCEDLKLDENLVKSLRHDPRAGLEAAIRKACVELVRERLETVP